VCFCAVPACFNTTFCQANPEALRTFLEPMDIPEAGRRLHVTVQVGGNEVCVQGWLQGGAVASGIPVKAFRVEGGRQGSERGGGGGGGGYSTTILPP